MRKGQASIEYIMVVSLVAALILPAIFLLYNFSNSSSEQIEQSQVNKIGRDIINTAEKVYYQGPPSRITLQANFPSNLKSVRVNKDWASNINELVFVFSSSNGESELVFSSKVNIDADFSDPRSYSSGIKNVRIEAIEGDPQYVLVTVQ